MTRKKVKLAFIVNDSARKAAYMKRKKSLLKKVEELSTLCGIDACAIVYSPYDPQPEVWPSPWGAQSVISKFRMMPELDKSRKMLDQETFLKQRILKAKDQLKKQENENKEKAMTMFMYQCLAAGKIVDNNMVDLSELSCLIDQKLKDIGRRIETLDRNFQVMAPSQVHVAQLVPTFQLTMANNEERTSLDHAHELSNGNGYEEVPFGHVNLSLGDYFSNPLP